MITVNYPEPSFRIKKENEQHYLFDPIRKTWLLLTEEEWVRQNFIQYLIATLHYPTAMIALEKELWINGLKKRFDVLVYNKEHQPWMLIECKAPQVVLHDAALQQVLRYQIGVPASFLVITNGGLTYGWEKTNGELKLIRELPAWENETSTS
jgi:hypothetical protein